MNYTSELNAYLDSLCVHLGHKNRHGQFIDYCSGLLQCAGRKSVEPMAAALAPEDVRSMHQSLHHFVADSNWSDRALLDGAWQWVWPKFPKNSELYWTVDDTGIPKKGKHSVGVSHQYCGQLGKQANCQVAVSLSVCCAEASVPVDYRLYLPQSWAEDQKRLAGVGVPEAIEFSTKPAIALEQIKQACEREMPRGCVLADSAYGNDNEFREGVDELGLRYMVGINPSSNIWAPGVKPLKPKAYSGRGPRPKRMRFAKGHEPVSCETLAQEMDESRWRHVKWREGTNAPLASWFCAVRVRVAHNDHLRSELREEQWLLIEWPEDEPAPSKYWLSNLPGNSSLKKLVGTAKMRWRIERDYQELKDELGLNHYEGRNWRGFHHHATLCIVSYVFLVGQQLRHPGRKKKIAKREKFTLPENYIPRGSTASTTTC